MLPSGPCSLEPQERDGQCQSLRDGRGVSHGEEREAGAGAEPSVPRTPLPTHRGDVMTSSAFWAPPLVRGHPWWDQDTAFLLRPPGRRLVSEKVALPRLVAHSRTPQPVPPADSALARRRARRGVRAEASSVFTECVRCRGGGPGREADGAGTAPSAEPKAGSQSRWTPNSVKCGRLCDISPLLSEVTAFLRVGAGTQLPRLMASGPVLRRDAGRGGHRQRSPDTPPGPQRPAAPHPRFLQFHRQAARRISSPW